MKIKENGTIIIPIDFSEQSITALKYSYNIARFTGSKLFLLHAFHKPEEKQEDLLRELATATEKESGLSCGFSCVKGDIYEETKKIAKTLLSNLIVTGIENPVRVRTFLGRSAFGNFLKDPPCEVLTVRSKNNSTGCKTIVMPFDLSPETNEKVDTAIHIAKFYNAEIRIVTVFDPADAAYEDKILPYMQQVKQFIKKRNVKCTNKSIPSRYPIESIVDYAKQNEADLIIQMNNSSHKFSRLIGGMQCDKIIELSSIPVLTIKPVKRESLVHFGSGL